MNRNLRAKSSTTELAKKVNQKISELRKNIFFSHWANSLY